MNVKGLIKKGVILVCLVGVGTAGFLYYQNMQKKAAAGPTVVTIPLQRMDLSRSVSANGSVESATAAKVHTGLNSEVKKVYVQVGDKVAAGEVLCDLDTAKLELDIAQMNAQINKAAAAAQHDITVNQRKYEEAKGNLSGARENDTVSAKGAVELAKNAMENARAEYERARKQLDNYDDDDYDYTIGESYASKESLRRIKSDALRAYDSARISYRNAVNEMDVSEDSKTKNEKKDTQSLTEFEDAIKQSRLAGNTAPDELALKKLRLDLADSVVAAPVSGTVTAVYAKEGAPAGGLMFVVEDTENLVVKTRIREFDIASVKEGLTAKLKADATGEKVFDGSIKRIYPTAVKGPDGTTVTSGNVEFETDVALLSRNTGLRVGMSVRMDIITEQKANALAAPFDAVTQNAAGNTVVFVVREGEGAAAGTAVAKELPVTVGMETDFYLEVSSAELKEGDEIIADPTGLTDGMPIVVPGMMPNADASPLGEPPAGAPGSSSVSGSSANNESTGSSAAVQGPAAPESGEAQSGASSSQATGGAGASGASSGASSSQATGGAGGSGASSGASSSQAIGGAGASGASSGASSEG